MIVFHDITKVFKNGVFINAHKALSNLSFSVNQGETLGLIGPNGAGKSTSIRLLMDFIRPDKGNIQIFGKSPRFPDLRQKIGYLPEVANFPANLNVCNLLHFTGATCNIPKTTIGDRSQELLTQLDLWKVRYRPLRSYSKGMQQRANFAIALLNDPELLILDEPMSGLDPIGRKKIIDLIGQLKKAGKTILFCSHILEDVDRLVDNVLLLNNGKKIFHGPPDKLATEEKKPSMAEAFVSRIQREEGYV